MKKIARRGCVLAATVASMGFLAAPALAIPGGGDTARALKPWFNLCEKGVGASAGVLPGVGVTFLGCIRLGGTLSDQDATKLTGLCEGAYGGTASREVTAFGEQVVCTVPVVG